MIIIAGTGHRPDKLGGYSEEAEAHVYGVTCRFLMTYQPDEVVSGMALGWDQQLARAATVLGIPLIAAVPFKGQESQWPASSQERYNQLLAYAKEVVIVCPGSYDPHKMQVRNMWMMNRCTSVLALWNGSPGGTANCIKYAKQIKRPIINLWSHLVDLNPELSK